MTDKPAVELKVMRLPNLGDLPLPSYATDLSAGMDLFAAIPENEPVTIQPGNFALVPSGLAVAIPPGFEVQIRARSGLCMRHGIFVLNGVGTIDADYRGEMKIILANFGKEPFTINRGERIGQMVMTRFTSVAWVPVDSLDSTSRTGGFGSTGV
ncbi:MAG TPA: dUTP diphosphatase [Rhodospirillaceae bacterium]|nr:MAG: deoxyuridine 5'-triphosphate nucleotidohydrolase [Alphaproteobacteria bacterium GWF2_58_20]HAU29479.1 dUTP diphosphatase [Rhodospirillaceae bacterium]